MALRTAIYMRVSTQDQSVESQRHELRRFILVPDGGQDLQPQADPGIGDLAVELIESDQPLLAISQLHARELTLVDRCLLGELGLKCGLPAQISHLVRRQAEVVGNLRRQSMGIPPVQDNLHDDRPVEICQSLGHATNVL